MLVSSGPLVGIDTVSDVQVLRHPRVGVRRILESRDTTPTRALQIAGFVERRSSVLPSTLAREAYAGDSKLVTSRAFADMHKCDGAAAFPSALPVRGRARADVIVVGRLHRAQRRLRAFYFSSRMTASVHERLIPGRPGFLAHSVRIMDLMRGASEIVVPYVYETGEGVFVEWIVEELLDGKHPTPEEYPAVASRLALGLVSMYAKTGVRPRPLSSFPTKGLADAVAGLAALPEVGRDRYDVEDIRERARRLLEAGGDVLVGHCHGDPVLGNTLIMPDGRIGLIDWEYAGERPIAHDLAKLITGNFIGDHVVELLDTAVSSLCVRMTVPWRHQLAFATMGLLRDWPAQRERASRSDGVRSRDRVLRRRLDMAAKLLDV